MKYRIDITPIIDDTRAAVKKKYFDSLGFKGKIKDVFLVDSYTIDTNINEKQIQEAAKVLTNPLIEKSMITPRTVARQRSRLLRGETGKSFDWAIEVGYLPGVTDTVGLTAKQTIADRFGVKFKQDEGVYTSVVYFIVGKLSEDEIKKLADNLYNPLIQRARIINFPDFKKDDGMGIEIPKVELHHTPQIISVDLNVSDEELQKIGTEGIGHSDGSHRGPLALSLSEMKAIQAYFKKLKRNPTDVELESLAQTWSEHCKHTIFNDPLDDIKDGLFKTYIKRATEEINKKFCVSVFKDNSGAIEFDENYLITHKVETHNSPSALDPFGGAVTGIVGVNRDCLGFGLGAKPIVNTYGFCFANPKDEIVLYRDRNKTQKMLSPRRIMEGVIEGVNVGGNSSGIPTPLGFVFFDDRFRGKPLVFVGTIGIIPKKTAGRLSHIKKAEPGDYIVMIGGRVGLDGIHGATFSSESLNVKSQTSSVQIGDPITQKKLSDALIRDARDRGLYNSITDNGAGGLSSSVGETAQQSGGCEVWLEKVPLKYPGLDPWQIWISESQERMTLAVPKDKWEVFKKVMDLHDVEATIIGEFTASGRCVVKYNNETVMDVALEFLHNGRPKKMQKSKKTKSSSFWQVRRNIGRVQNLDSGQARVTSLENQLKDINNTSYEFISQQFDHTVQGTSTIRPLHGKGRVNADAIVVKPLPDSQKGIVTSQGINPTDSDIDTYYMAAAAIDTAVRNAVAVGADPDYLAILDNFCWSSSDEPERLYELKRAVKACYDYATIFGTPFISGKDSMFNDFKGFDTQGKPVKISAPPTLLISTLGVIPDVRKSITLDFKSPGDLIYVLGDMKNDPKKNKELYQTIYRAVQQELIPSAIGVGRGGLAIALVKSAIGGMIGIEVNYDDSLLFSECQGRLVVSVSPQNQKAFETIMEQHPYQCIGKVSSDTNIRINKTVLDVKKAYEAYKSTLKDY